MDSHQETGGRNESSSALKALAGFFLTPLAGYLMLLAQLPVLIAFGLLALLTMLAFPSTRAFSLGGLLSIGASLIVLLAICGRAFS